jgi:holliday junction DNA helicase RuvB
VIINTYPEYPGNELRPKFFHEIIGQDQIVERLKTAVRAAKATNKLLGHTLFYGPPGIGKTTFARVLANEMGVNIRITAAPSIERGGDLAAILTHLREGDILFIDQLHLLSQASEEILLPAMEQFVLHIVVGKVTATQSIRLNLPYITVIGSTRHISRLSLSLRSGFIAAYHLNFYSVDDLTRIVLRAAELMHVPITTDDAQEVANQSQGTPRMAIYNLLNRK